MEFLRKGAFVERYSRRIDILKSFNKVFIFGNKLF